MDNDIERVKQLLGGYNHDPEHADMHASLDRIITYAGRYRWLREYAVSAGWKMPRCPTPVSYTHLDVYKRQSYKTHGKSVWRLTPELSRIV